MPIPRRAPRILALFVLLLAAIGTVWAVKSGAAVPLLEKARGAGPLGVLAFALAAVAAATFTLPVWIIGLAAGFAYGMWGALVVIPACVLGGLIAMALGRTLVRDFILVRAERIPRFAAIAAAVAQRGLLVVMCVRLSPILPCGLFSYAFGLTRVRVRDYIVGTFLGMLPLTLLYVYLGTALTRAADLDAGKIPPSPLTKVALGVGLALTIVLVVWIVRVAQRTLSRALTQAEQA